MTFNFKKLICLSATFLIAACTIANTPVANWQLSATEFGPVKIGMSVSEAEKISGQKIIKKPLGVTGEESCRYATFSEEPSNVLIMLNNDKIVEYGYKKSQL